MSKRDHAALGFSLFAIGLAVVTVYVRNDLTSGELALLLLASAVGGFVVRAVIAPGKAFTS